MTGLNSCFLLMNQSPQTLGHTEHQFPCSRHLKCTKVAQELYILIFKKVRFIAHAWHSDQLSNIR